MGVTFNQKLPNPAPRNSPFWRLYWSRNDIQNSKEYSSRNFTITFHCVPLTPWKTVPLEKLIIICVYLFIYLFIHSLHGTCSFIIVFTTAYHWTLSWIIWIRSPHYHPVSFKSILTLILLTWRIWWAHNNASKWQMGFNSAFKGLILSSHLCTHFPWNFFPSGSLMNILSAFILFPMHATCSCTSCSLIWST